MGQTLGQLKPTNTRGGQPARNRPKGERWGAPRVSAALRTDLVVRILPRRGGPFNTHVWWCGVHSRWWRRGTLDMRELLAFEARDNSQANLGRDSLTSGAKKRSRPTKRAVNLPCIMASLIRSALRIPAQRLAGECVHQTGVIRNAAFGLCTVHERLQRVRAVRQAGPGRRGHCNLRRAVPLANLCLPHGTHGRPGSFTGILLFNIVFSFSKRLHDKPQAERPLPAN